MKESTRSNEFARNLDSIRSRRARLPKSILNPGRYSHKYCARPRDVTCRESHHCVTTATLLTVRNKRSNVTEKLSTMGPHTWGSRVPANRRSGVLLSNTRTDSDGQSLYTAPRSAVAF